MAFLCVSYYTFETLTSVLKHQRAGIEKGEDVCPHPSWQGTALGLQGISELRVWLVWFPYVHLLFPSGNLFAGGIWAFSTFVQDLWMFGRLGRGTMQLRFQIRSCYMFRTNTERICRKSDGVWAASQKPAVELIWVFSIIPTRSRSTGLKYFIISM